MAPAAEALVDLLGRMTECDGRVTHINGSAPSGDKRRLREVELAARNLERFTRDEPSIVTELKLPGWANSTMLAWPPRRAFDPASFAPVPYDRRHSSEWERVAEEQALAQQERDKREAAEREAKALENYHGPRWWEHESDRQGVR